MGDLSLSPICEPNKAGKASKLRGSLPQAHGGKHQAQAGPTENVVLPPETLKGPGMGPVAALVTKMSSFSRSLYACPAFGSRQLLAF